MWHVAFYLFIYFDQRNLSQKKKKTRERKKKLREKKKTVCDLKTNIEKETKKEIESEKKKNWGL